MALEDKIDALIAALEANTAALAGGEKPAATKPAASKPAASKPGRPAKPKGPKLEDLTTLAGNMLKGGTDLDADDAKAALKSFKEHFGFKPSDCPDDKLADAMAALTALSEGEDPFDDGDGDEDDASSMV